MKKILRILLLAGLVASSTKFLAHTPLELLDLVENKTTSTPTLRKQFFDELVKELSQNNETYDLLYNYNQDRTIKVTVEIIQKNQNILQKFLRVFPTIKLRTDGHKPEIINTITKIYEKILDNQAFVEQVTKSFAKKINSIESPFFRKTLEISPNSINQRLKIQFFDELVKQITQNYPNISLIANYWRNGEQYETVKTAAQLIKNDSTFLQKFLLTFPKTEPRTDSRARYAHFVLKEIFKKLLDDQRINKQIAETIFKNTNLSNNLLLLPVALKKFPNRTCDLNKLIKKIPSNGKVPFTRDIQLSLCNMTLLIKNNKKALQQFLKILPILHTETKEFFNENLMISKEKYLMMIALNLIEDQTIKKQAAETVFKNAKTVHPLLLFKATIQEGIPNKTVEKLLVNELLKQLTQNDAEIFLIEELNSYSSIKLLSSVIQKDQEIFLKFLQTFPKMKLRTDKINDPFTEKYISIKCFLTELMKNVFERQFVDKPNTIHPSAPTN